MRQRARRTGGGAVTGADGVLADGVELTHARVLGAHVHGLGQEELPVKHDHNASKQVR